MLEDILVFQVNPPAFTRGMNGDVVQLHDGRLLFAFAQAPDGPPGILACTSADVGRTWSAVRTLLPPPDPRLSSPSGEYLAHPSFLRRQNGQLMMAYPWMVQDLDPYGHTYYRLSADEGETWGDPKVLTATSARSSMIHNNKLVRLSDGRILAPAEIRVDLGLANDHRGYVSAVWHSDDDGHTWQRSRNAVTMLDQGVEVQEPHVVELKGGRLMMLFRTYSGFVGVSYSADQGDLWSAGQLVEALPLPSHSSALHVSRIPSTGDLLLVRSTGDGGKEPAERPLVFHRLDGRKHGIRTPLTAIISQDEGESWVNERVIAGDPYGDYGYPSVLHLDDVTLISYHALDGLHVARIQPEWFYEGV